MNIRNEKSRIWSSLWDCGGCSRILWDGWDGTGRDGMGWDGMGRDGTGWDGIPQDIPLVSNVLTISIPGYPTRAQVILQNPIPSHPIPPHLSHTIPLYPTLSLGFPGIL
jgi:hypothetical protein